MTQQTIQTLTQQSEQDIIGVTAADLPLHCPTPGMPAWSAHPRVFLDIVHTRQASCPYCGTRFKLVGDTPHGH